MDEKPAGDNSLTDWERLDNVTDEDIDVSDIPEITPEMFARAIVRRGLRPEPTKKQVKLKKKHTKSQED